MDVVNFLGIREFGGSLPPQGEGESRSVCKLPWRHGYSQALDRILPLPEGEGRGEGEGRLNSGGACSKKR